MRVHPNLKSINSSDSRAAGTSRTLAIASRGFRVDQELVPHATARLYNSGSHSADMWKENLAG